MWTIYGFYKVSRVGPTLGKIRGEGNVEIGEPLATFCHIALPTRTPVILLTSEFSELSFFHYQQPPISFSFFFCFSKWKTFLLSFCWQLFCAATTEQGKFLKWLNWIGLDKFAARKTLNLQWLKAPPLLSRFCTCKWTAVGSQSGDVTIESYL